MSRQIKIIVPVKSFVKKFIEAKYYNQRDGFLLPRRDEPLGRLLEGFFEKNFTTVPEEDYKGTSIKVRIYCDSKLMHIPKKRIGRISLILEDWFREAIILYGIAHYNENENYQPGVEKFLDMYGINEDDLSVNSAMRMIRLWEEKTARYQKKFRGESERITANV
jgi:hypothetical protein